MKGKKWIIVLVVLALVAIGAAVAARSDRLSFAAPIGNPSGETRTTAVAEANGAMGEREEVALACTGRIEGESEAVAVGAGMDGIIAEVRVKEGEQVAAGALVAVIERRELAAELSEARAAVERAKALRDRLLTGSRTEERDRAGAQSSSAAAVVRQAQARYERYEKLYEQGVISADVRDEALRDVEVARANLRAARKNEEFINASPLTEELAKADAEVQAAEQRVRSVAEQVKKCEVRAPVAGTILRTNMKVGEAYSTFAPQPIVTMADTSRFRVRAEVDERDVDKIYLGQKVLITGDAFQNRNLFGRVSRLSSQMGRKKVLTGDPAEKSDRDVLEVLVDVEGRDKSLVVGLRVTAQFLRQ